MSSHLFTFYFLFPSKEFLVFLKQSLAVAPQAFLGFFKVCFWTSAALPTGRKGLGMTQEWDFSGNGYYGIINQYAQRESVER